MKQSRLLSTLLLSIFLVLGFLAYREFLQINILAYIGNQNVWNSRRFIVFLALCVLSLVLFALSIRAARENKPYLPFLERVRRLPGWFIQISAGLITTLPALTKWFLPLPDTIDLRFWTIFFLMYCAALLAVWLTKNKNEEPETQLLKVGMYWLIGGAAYAICSKLVFVTDYPFPLYWSEGNRFFDYSTLFGAFRYNFPKDSDIYVFTNWGMQLPWALPFIFPNLSIGAYRLWYQLMWIVPTFVLGITASKTFSREKGLTIIALIFGVWTFVFLDQGPIYAPLVIACILTMLGLRLRLVPAFLTIILASYYAYESRWTWSFAPGLWAGIAALLMIKDLRFCNEKLKELVRPVMLGLAGFFGGRILPQMLLILTSWFNSIYTKITNAGVPDATKTSQSISINVIPNIISSATRQPLLWDRLFPNSTYSPGILLGVTWAALPIIFLLLVLVIKKNWRTNWLQVTTVFIVSATFFAVGLTASVKIGGGSNLHNLDMFLVTLIIPAAAALVDFYLHRKNNPVTKFWLSAFIAMVMVFPITYAFQFSEKPHLPDAIPIEESLSKIRNTIGKVRADENILFIDHRQLLTFNLVPQVPLVDDYEKKKLMDKAMSADTAYFEPFYADIHNHRFALIINEPLNVIIRGEDYSFGDENNAYVKWVTVPLACSYEAIYTNYETGVELLIPRVGPRPDNLPCENFSKLP